MLELIAGADREWMTRAKCRGHSNPDLWFPESGGANITARARAVCMRCPVIGDCAAYAERTGETAGIWGGRSRGVGAADVVVVAGGVAESMPARRRAG